MADECSDDVPQIRWLDRAAGLVVAGFGVLLLLAVVPGQVEAVDYGWVRPETLPNALAMALIVLGVLQVVLAGGGASVDLAAAGRAGFYLGFATLFVWAMSRLGFVWVAPPAMLVLMLLIGERRPLWLGLGALALPAVVWWGVVVLLGRTLPG